MIHALVNKFNPLDEDAVQSLMSSIQTLELLDMEDLSIYHDKHENFNLQLLWVGQDMKEFHIVYLAQTQIKKSRYKKDIEALQISNIAFGVTFGSLHELCTGLERLDCLCGHPYASAATPKSQPKVIQKNQKSLVFVGAVQDSFGLVTSIYLKVKLNCFNHFSNTPLVAPILIPFLHVLFSKIGPSRRNLDLINQHLNPLVMCICNSFQ